MWIGVAALLCFTVLGEGIPEGRDLGGIHKNGFDLSRHKVPIEEIRHGGPPKDGIPAIVEPIFLAAKEVTFLQPNDRVLGITNGKEAKAYPVKILNWHEVVNDVVQGKPVLITYCPLCGSGVGFLRRVNGDTYTFGVSGLLYQSDMLMYDHQTHSLWSQLAMEAVAGPLTGATLTPIMLVHTTWEAWRRAHPTTKVLSTETGFHRNYDLDPYLGYAGRIDLMFPVNHKNDQFHPKEWIVGIQVDGVAKAYPFSELAKAPGPVIDWVRDSQFVITYNSQARTAVVFDSAHQPIPSVMAYWFAWYAFHPHTLIYTYSSPAQ